MQLSPESLTSGEGGVEPQIGQSPVLVGHSMGGYVVQRYLERCTT